VSDDEGDGLLTTPNHIKEVKDPKPNQLVQAGVGKTKVVQRPQQKRGTGPAEVVTMDEVLQEKAMEDGAPGYLIECYNTKGDRWEVWMTEGELVKSTSTGRPIVPPMLRRWWQKYPRQ